MRLPDPVVFSCMGLGAKRLRVIGCDRLVPVHERERLKMMEHYSFPDTTPAAYGPYSHAVVAGDFVFLAGQIARDAVSGHLIDGDITAQTARCLEIVSDILKKLGLSLADVVRTTVFLSDIGDFDAMNRVYAAAFQAPYPVLTEVGLLKTFVVNEHCFVKIMVTMRAGVTQGKQPRDSQNENLHSRCFHRHSI
jgi:2-iminobutanoate/2-iminopropanoate deaminase